MPSDPAASQCVLWSELISAKHTIYPGVTDDCRTLWKLQFGNLCFHSFIFQGNLLDKKNLLAIAWSMDVRS